MAAATRTMTRRPPLLFCVAGLMVIFSTVLVQLLFVYIMLYSPAATDKHGRPKHTSLLASFVGLLADDRTAIDQGHAPTPSTGCPTAAPRPAQRIVEKITVPVLVPTGQVSRDVIMDGIWNIPDEWLWKKSKATCDVGKENHVDVDPFPPDFHPAIYAEANRESWNKLNNNNPAFASIKMDVAHYNLYGRSRGWKCTEGQHLRGIINERIIPKLPGYKLEVAPACNPVLYGHPSIKYFEIMDKKSLIERTEKLGAPGERPVDIDYIHPSGDLRSIPDKGNFSMVLSSHAIEHQLDLVRHFNMVSNLLRPGGYYVMMAPDKRYCFDRYVPESSIGNVLDDYYNNRQKTAQHTVASVITSFAMQAHNNPLKHWEGSTEEAPITMDPNNATTVARLKSLLEMYRAHTVEKYEYIDAHNYRFTPQTFARIVDTLHAMGLTPLRVHHLYDTIAGNLEFGVVLKKCGTGTDAKVD